VAFPQIATFARLANGAETPKRVIAGQATKLSRAMHDIQYDEVHDEVIIANPFAQAVLIYRGGVNGEEPPIRVLQGPRTQIGSPSFGVDVDPANDELYVSEANSILVFPRTANGNVAPIRVIQGPDAKLEGARALAVDPVVEADLAETLFRRIGNMSGIEVGKLADLVVVDRDYMTVPEDDLSEIQTLMTMVGGKVVYETAGAL